MVARLQAADLSVVSLFDAERDELVNNWGGAWGTGNMRDVRLESQWVHSGRRALCCELGPTRAGELRYTQCLASGFGRTAGHRQVRDLARFQRMTFAVLNRTGVPLRGMLQIKDYRDSLAHRAVYRFAVPAGERWTEVELRLKPTDGRLGSQRPARSDPSPDDRFRLRARLGSGGRMRVPRRSDLDGTGRPPGRGHQLRCSGWWNAWRGGNGTDFGRRGAAHHGLIPNNSYQSSDAGLNTTSAVLWMLPAAVAHAWVSCEQADGYVRLVAETFQGLMDRSLYLPPRNVDWVTLGAVAAARGIVGGRGISGVGLTSIPIAQRDFRGIAASDRASAESPRFCGLCPPGGLADGLPLRDAFPRRGLRGRDVRRIHQ